MYCVFSILIFFRVFRQLICVFETKTNNVFTVCFTEHAACVFENGHGLKNLISRHTVYVYVTVHFVFLERGKVLSWKCSSILKKTWCAYINTMHIKKYIC